MVFGWPKILEFMYNMPSNPREYRPNFDSPDSEISAKCGIESTIEFLIGSNGRVKLDQHCLDCHLLQQSKTRNETDHGEASLLPSFFVFQFRPFCQNCITMSREQPQEQRFPPKSTSKVASLTMLRKWRTRPETTNYVHIRHNTQYSEETMKAMTKTAFIPIKTEISLHSQTWR